MRAATPRDALDTVKAALENPDIVKGFKAHAELGGFARWGIEVIRLSAEIAQRAGLPLYIHFGQLWGLPESGANGVDPDTILEQVVPLLKPGDILAHPFTRHPGGFVDKTGRMHPIVAEAQAIVTAAGHGSRINRTGAKKKPTPMNHDDRARSHRMTAVSHRGLEPVGASSAAGLLPTAVGRSVIGHLLCGSS